MYRRSLQPLVHELLKEFRILYLTGPRQAGKTTLARAVARDLEMAYITLDDQATWPPWKVTLMGLSVPSGRNGLWWMNSSMRHLSFPLSRKPLTGLSRTRKANFS